MVNSIDWQPLANLLTRLARSITLICLRKLPLWTKNISEALLKSFSSEFATLRDSRTINNEFIRKNIYLYLPRANRLGKQFENSNKNRRERASEIPGAHLLCKWINLLLLEFDYKMCIYVRGGEGNELSNSPPSSSPTAPVCVKRERFEVRLLGGGGGARPTETI